MIYPDTVSAVARRTLFYIRTVRPDIALRVPPRPDAHSLRHAPRKFPVERTGDVPPKRVEFLTSPADRRLFDAVVQTARGPRVPPCRAVQQPRPGRYPRPELYARAAGFDHRPAVHADLGHGGRRRDVRNGHVVVRPGTSALVLDGLPRHGPRRPRPGHRDRRNIDKWFCGSYRDYIPDHYELGYQICSYAYDRYGEEVWDKVARYGSRNPYVLATTRVALEKYYDTNVSRLFRETFDELERHWDSLPQVEDSAEPLTPMPDGNYTTYQWPLPLDDTSALALKTDYDRPSRFVRLDTRTGERRRSAIRGWSRPAPRWPAAACGGPNTAVRSSSNSGSIRSCATWTSPTVRPGRSRTAQRALSHAVGDAVAWVEYNPDGRYTVVVQGREGAETAFDARPVRDSRTGVGRCDAGLLRHRHRRFGHVDRPHRRRRRAPVTEGAYITLSNLRAGGGKLYYGSIASGRDEAHCYDLMARREYRITTSAYGSFMPVPWRAGEGRERVLLTAYDRRGYRVAAQDADADALIPVAPSQLPRQRGESRPASGGTW